MPTRSVPRRQRFATKGGLVETYDYHDNHGRVIYKLARYAPKDFQFLKANDQPWLKTRRRRPLLYRLPEILAAESHLPVYFVEGEKDVNRLWSEGLVATCNDGGGGQGKWSLAHSRPLRGRSVIITPDNDQTGREHALDVARRLRERVSELRIVTLSGLPPKGDVSDWLNGGNTVGDLIRLCSQSPVWDGAPNSSFRPSLDRNDLHNAAIQRGEIIGSSLSAQEKLLLIILLDARVHAAK